MVICDREGKKKNKMDKSECALWKEYFCLVWINMSCSVSECGDHFDIALGRHVNKRPISDQVEVSVPDYVDWKFFAVIGTILSKSISENSFAEI